MTFEERVAEAYEWAGRHMVLRVDSAAAMAEVRKLVQKKTEAFRYGVLFDIDYSQPEPVRPILEAYPGILEHQEYLVSVQSEMTPERVAGAQYLHPIFQTLEAMDVASHVFIRNAHKMSVDQCSSLVSLTVSMQNSSTLHGVCLYLPGGDWWDYPHFTADRKDGGADLKYARISGLEVRFGDAFNKARMEGFPRLYTTQATNIHGPHFSGKTGYLYSQTFHGLKPQLVSVYEEGTTEAQILDVLSKRMLDGRTLLLDDVHRLAPGALDAVRSRYPNIICASLEKLPGFETNIDTQPFLRK
jgi:hypothetical protein